MRVLFYYTARRWTGSARLFAAVAREMMRRGAQVTFVPAPESAVEQRVAYDGYEVVPVNDGGPWMAESWRLRQVLLDRFV